jgi:hypothetical protein
MTECLFVVIGAGASYASTTPENVEPGGIGIHEGLTHTVLRSDPRPPLVTELFAPRFAAILNKYPLAQMAASDIRRQSKTPVAIEEFLRTQYRDSDHELDQRKFHAVHWYLQDLLWTISQHYTSHPDNYDRLIAACLRLPRVVFITLNYDTLLDDRLRIVQPIDSMDGYVDPDRRWSLVKLHGSVDWGLPIQSLFDGTDIVNPPAEIAVARTDIHLRRPGANTIDDVRLERMGAQYFYPAMSVPVGSRDEFSCPDTHIGFVRNLMQSQEHLDVLMLGYSALDQEVLTLLQESGKPLRSLLVVNAGRDSAAEARERVEKAVGIASRMGGSSRSAFEQFVGSDELEDHLARLARL